MSSSLSGLTGHIKSPPSCSDTLLAHTLLAHLQRLSSWSHNRILTLHPPSQGSVELCAQCELAQVIRLLLVWHIALADKLLVLQLIKARGNGVDLGLRAVRAEGVGEGVVGGDGWNGGVTLRVARGASLGTVSKSSRSKKLELCNSSRW